MNGKQKAALSVVIAVILAVALVGAYIYSTSTTTTSTNSSLTTSEESSGPSGPTGTLAVLMTDPPTIPDGVTAVYINYTDIAIHVSNAGNQTGWTNLGASGEINLLGIVNSTQTIATANITTGTFNAVKFNITSAVVTFQGQNYTADLVYQEHYLLVTIPGGIYVKNGSTAGAVIDMTPTILLLGNTTSPVFAFLPEAKGYALPANSVAIHPRVGDTNDYQGQIWTQIHNEIHFQITGATLTPNSFSITVDNTGGATVVFRFAAITSTTTVSGGWVPSTPFGAISKISEFFVVVPNGSLVPITASTNKQLIQTMALAGYTVAPHQSVTFTYNGPITIGALTLLEGHTPTQPINVGQNYVVTQTGSGFYARSAVTATSGSSTSTTSSVISSSTATTSATSSSSSTTSVTTSTTSSPSSTASTSTTSTTTTS